jgi:hypothetical protein
MPWVYNPHKGGVKIPPVVQQHTAARLRKYALAKHAARIANLQVHFQGALCYIDAVVIPEEPSQNLLKALGKTREEFMKHLQTDPIHLCRLRYFGAEDAWSLAFYQSGRNRYEPCCFDTGRDHGTPGEALEMAAAGLLNR